MTTPQRRPFSAIAVSLVALIVAVIALGNPFARSRDDQRETKLPGTLDKVRTSKRIRVGYVVNVRQVDRDAKTGSLSGFHYDLIKKIADDAGFATEFEETTFSTAGAQLNTGQLDVVIGGGYESVNRALEITFADPIMYIPLGYVARADDERFKSEDDLKKPGIKVAVTAGGASADYLKMYLSEATPVILARNELSRIVLEVTSGRADVGIGNAANCVRFAKEQPGVKFVTRGKPFFLFSSGFLIRQGEADWLHVLNSGIRQHQANGFTQRLDAKYNPDGNYWIPVKRP